MKRVFIILLLPIFFSCSYAQERKTLAYSQENNPVYKKIEQTDSLALDKTWKQFIKAIEKKDEKRIRKLSLKKIDCVNCVTTDHEKGPPLSYLVLTDTFIRYVFEYFSIAPVSRAIKLRGYETAYYLDKYDPTDSTYEYLRGMNLYEVYVTTYLPNEIEKGHEGGQDAFQFVKIKGEFKFSGWSPIP